MKKEETVALKGIAIILMFWHHLFGCGTSLMLEENTWMPVLGNIDVWIGEGCKLCIALFTFASGVGLWESYLKKDIGLIGIFRRAIKFIIPYWVIMFLMAIPYLIYFKTFNPRWLLVNLFALIHNDEILYVSFSWYVKVYLGILLVLPLTKIVFKNSKNILKDLLLIIICLIFQKFLSDSGGNYTNIIILLIVRSIILLLTWYPIFMLGVIFEKYDLFKKMNLAVDKIKDSQRLRRVGIMICCIISMLIAIGLRKFLFFGVFTDVLATALFVIAFHIMYLYSDIWWKRWHSLLIFLGKYSFQYWLISGMFFLNTTELQWILVLPKYSLLILAWKFLIITPFALIYGNLSNWLSTRLVRKIPAV